MAIINGRRALEDNLLPVWSARGIELAAPDINLARLEFEKIFPGFEGEIERVQ